MLRRSNDHWQTGYCMEFGYPVLGFVVGAVVGMTGMGGGAIMTAALIGLFGVPALTAVGTDLVYASVTKVVGTSVHARNRNVDWRVVALLTLGSIPATGIMLYVLSQVGLANPRLELWVTRFLGVVILLAALTIVWRRSLELPHLDGVGQDAANQALTALVVARTVALGVAIGAVVTISSVGAGAIGVALLMALYPAMAAARIVGTDIAHAVPLTLVAGLGHAFIGSVDWSLLVLLLVGSLPGIYVGSHVAHLVPDRYLMTGLAVVLMAIGVRLLLLGAH
jgi:uncharacterized protein